MDPQDAQPPLCEYASCEEPRSRLGACLDVLSCKACAERSAAACARFLVGLPYQAEGTLQPQRVAIAAGICGGPATTRHWPPCWLAGSNRIVALSSCRLERLATPPSPCPPLRHEWVQAARSRSTSDAARFALLSVRTRCGGDEFGGDCGSHAAASGPHTEPGCSAAHLDIRNPQC